MSSQHIDTLMRDLFNSNPAWIKNIESIEHIMRINHIKYNVAESIIIRIIDNGYICNKEIYYIFALCHYGNKSEHEHIYCMHVNSIDDAKIYLSCGTIFTEKNMLSYGTNIKKKFYFPRNLRYTKFLNWCLNFNIHGERLIPFMDSTDSITPRNQLNSLPPPYSES